MYQNKIIYLLSSKDPKWILPQCLKSQKLLIYGYYSKKWITHWKNAGISENGVPEWHISFDQKIDVKGIGTYIKESAISINFIALFSSCCYGK